MDLSDFIPIPLHDGYLINENGDVFSMKTNKLLSPYYSKRGYVFYTVSQKTMSRHRLKALAFLGVPEDLTLEVNHKNRIKGDDRTVNLEWISKSENSIHGRYGEIRQPKPRINTKRKNSGKNGFRKEKKKIAQYKDGVKIAEFDSTVYAMKLTGFHRTALGACANGKAKSAYGYNWEYI